MTFANRRRIIEWTTWAAYVAIVSGAFVLVAGLTVTFV